MEAVGLALVFGLILASIVAWCFVIAGASTGLTFRQVPHRKVPWGLIDLGLAVLLVAVAGTAAGVILVRFKVTEPGQKLQDMTPENVATMLLASSVSMLVGVALAVGLIWLKNRPTLSDLGLSLRNFRRNVGIGVVMFLLVSAPVYAIQYLLVEVFEFRSEHPLIQLVQENPDARFFIVSLIAAVVIAPITEEMLFRVLLQGWLERVPGHRGDARVLVLGGKEVEPDTGDADTSNANGSTEHRTAIWPVIVSSAAFALMHSSHGVDPIPLFVLAFGLGFVYRQTHSVLPCILIHMLFNGFSLTLLLVEVYGFAES